MINGVGRSFPESRLARIAAQIERLESRQAEWIPPSIEGRSENNSSPPVRRREEGRGSLPTGKCGFAFQWDWRRFLVIVRVWGDHIERLARAMRQQASPPFSLRTQQIAVLCAFVPFAISILWAGIRFIPNLPALPLWTKITWFVALPMFLAMAGALVGFLIGVLLDSLERRAVEGQRSSSEGGSLGAGVSAGQVGTRSGVWVAVEDLEPNQRVADTVMGPDGTPILLRHTLLKPSHIEMLKKQNVAKVKIEAVKYSSNGELAMAG